MSKILADACAQRERIPDRRVYVRRALHVDKTIVNEIGSCLREARDGAVASCFSGLGNFGQLWKIWDVGTGSEPVEMFFEEIRANGVEFTKWHAARLGTRSFVNQHDGFGLDSQATVMRQNACDMNPVSVTVFIRGSP